jgi:hypothetical protein
MSILKVLSFGFIGAILYLNVATAHEMVPTYPKWRVSSYENVLVKKTHIMHTIFVLNLNFVKKIQQEQQYHQRYALALSEINYEDNYFNVAYSNSTCR